MSMGNGVGETRLRLKRLNGWFAAGQEVNCALQLLSDAAFKVFMWICLHAERSCGSLCATRTQLALALGRTEDDIQRTLGELEQQQVCILGSGCRIEISDRFWPYYRSSKVVASDEVRRYVEQVKRLFLQRRCVQSSFTAADEKMALQLYRTGVSLTLVERAILLGAARKCCAVQRNGRGTPISSLHYFTQLLEEVRQEVSPQYWRYIAKKIEAFERDWTGFTPNALETKQY